MVDIVRRGKQRYETVILFSTSFGRSSAAQLFRCCWTGRGEARPAVQCMQIPTAFVDNVRGLKSVSFLSVITIVRHRQQIFPMRGRGKCTIYVRVIALLVEYGIPTRVSLVRVLTIGSMQTRKLRRACRVA
jgi:hypothetical protein